MAKSAPTLALTRAQVDQVVAQAVDGRRLSLFLDRIEDISHAVASGVLNDSRLSHSFLLGLAVLSALPRTGPGIGVNEFARQLGMSTSTVHRYLTTLVAAGLAVQDTDSRKYRLTAFPSAGIAPHPGERM